MAPSLLKVRFRSAHIKLYFTNKDVRESRPLAGVVIPITRAVYYFAIKTIHRTYTAHGVIVSCYNTARKHVYLNNVPRLRNRFSFQRIQDGFNKYTVTRRCRHHEHLPNVYPTV